MAKKRKSTKKSVTKTISLILVVLLCIVSLVFYLNPGLYDKFTSFLDGSSLLGDVNRENHYANEDSSLIVHFIDVGQGDAILFELPDSKIMLVDAGDNRSDNNTKLITYISELGVSQIDYLIATHADADHIGGMDKIFDNFEVKKVFRPYVYYSGEDYVLESSFNKGSPKYEQDSKTYGGFLNDILSETYVEDGKTKNCEWEYFTHESDFGANIIFEGKTSTYTVDFLTPTKELSDIYYEDPNDYSPIIKVSYCDFDMMLTGDAETEGESDFVEAYSKKEEYKKLVDVDLLKIAHHGSGTSTTEGFLKLVKPEIAVICCGEDNSYFHPHQEVLDRLLANNCKSLYRTDNNGDIVLTVDKLGEYKIDVSKDSTENFEAPPKN